MNIYYTEERDGATVTAIPQQEVKFISFAGETTRPRAGKMH